MIETLPIESNFLGIEHRYSSYAGSSIVILPVPYEHSVSYGTGTGQGPQAILEASHYVEYWDEEFQRELCFELGIATLPPISLNGLKDGKAVEKIQEEIKLHLDNDKYVVTLGGEHSISTAPVRAHFEVYPNMSVLQFDAHSDLREEYEGNPYSHASVMARILEFLPSSHVTQVGIRAQCKEEFERIQKSDIHCFFARGIRSGLYTDDWMDAVIDSLNQEVYITFDVDYFDPSIMPATGTPEPGGFLWDETLALLNKLAARKKLIGFDVVELSPDPAHPASSFLSAKLVYKLLHTAFLNAK
jgi:N1-aminopropylagmatine ureohydrolase